MPPLSLSCPAEERWCYAPTEASGALGELGQWSGPEPPLEEVACPPGGGVTVPVRGRRLPHEGLDMADELGGGHGSVLVGRDPVAHEVEERDVTELHPQGVQRQGPALVDA